MWMKSSAPALSGNHTKVLKLRVKRARVWGKQTTLFQQSAYENGQGSSLNCLILGLEISDLGFNNLCLGVQDDMESLRCQGVLHFAPEVQDVG